MAIKDFGKGLKEKIQDAADSVKEGVQNLDTKEIKENVKGSVHSASEKVKNTVKDVKLPDAKNLLKKKENTGAEETEEEEEPVEVTEVAAISTKSAIKIIYYMMAVDGEIYHSEEEKFNLIASELDPEFEKHREKILQSCQNQLNKVIDDADYYDVVQDGVELAVRSSFVTSDSFITPKLLVWNLLTVAYSDEHYDEAERKLLKYVVRKLNIDKDVFLEMESSIQTLIDLENEIAWLKTTNRPYLTIEAMVNEISDRKNVILESVKDLISL